MVDTNVGELAEPMSTSVVEVRVRAEIETEKESDLAETENKDESDLARMVQTKVETEEESDLVREVSLLNDSLSTTKKSLDCSMISNESGSNYTLATTLELIGETSTPDKVPEQKMSTQNDDNDDNFFEQSFDDEPTTANIDKELVSLAGDSVPSDEASSSPSKKSSPKKSLPKDDSSPKKSSSKDDSSPKKSSPKDNSSPKKSETVQTSSSFVPMLSAVGMVAPSNAAVSEQELEDEKAKFAVLMASSNRLVLTTIHLLLMFNVKPRQLEVFAI